MQGNGTRSLYVGLKDRLSPKFENYKIHEPTTLKDVLEFLDKLYTSQLYKNVGKQLENDAWVKDNFKEYGLYTVSNCFYNVCYYASSLRGYIEKDYKSHNKYKNLTYDKECIDRCVVTLLKVLPKLFGTLYFLWFNIDDRYGEGWHYYGGGKWQNQRFDGSSTYWSSGKDLLKWLTGNGSVDGSTTDSVKATLLPGGYQQSELSSYHGYKITSSLKGLVYYSAGGGYLQYILYYLVFDVEVGPACAALYSAFIRAFCEETVDNGLFANKINESVYPEMKTICASLPEKLRVFTADSFDSETLLYAVYVGSARNFRNRLKSENFERYIGGLKKIIDGLVDSLQQMSTDSKDWQDTVLQHGSAAGPFPYGFCITAKWKTSQWDRVRVKLPEKIKTLVGSDDNKQSLMALKKSLIRELPAK
ncbi:secreted antigen 1 [Babesia caballi]|uniref:Secreted antigen 1 n=1 Tax=Babesia caballi TaxID=5871 RepID=A0AAV4LY61_BABCB|nr:secreted antigen 1 [Babesia caballi]